MAFLFSIASPAHTLTLDEVIKGVQSQRPGGASGYGPQDQKTTISGLKEALSIGTQNAVRTVARVDGYFGNELIRILLPETLQKAAEVIGKLGYQQQVDQLVVSMNRAAEAAAPKAVSLFTQAIGEMTFDDAQKILQGGDTAATDFFKRKTSAKVFDQFKPVITSSMSKVGVAKAYKDMVAPYQALPFASKETMDLDHYVTTKALEGLFLMVAEEEKKIRTDPAARVTDLLRKVFSK
ncbi:MAG: DUF4197 domain-containing protein [Desulfobacteraceae bacterium]|nr:MAG: DUF4197 domain-containing protein [Desulfobacteraceae bacterium]